uniref:Uncharacterized protein n=1 Tax=Cacopsylla melanoneura TaxID=428564 RepID=A0A8D9BS46_9HEMI
MYIFLTRSKYLRRAVCPSVCSYNFLGNSRGPSDFSPGRPLLDVLLEDVKLRIGQLWRATGIEIPAVDTCPLNHGKRLWCLGSSSKPREKMRYSKTKKKGEKTPEIMG